MPEYRKNVRPPHEEAGLHELLRRDGSDMLGFVVGHTHERPEPQARRQRNQLEPNTIDGRKLWELRYKIPQLDITWFRWEVRPYEF